MVFLSEEDYLRWALLMQIILYTFPLQFHIPLSCAIIHGMRCILYFIVPFRFFFGGIKKHFFEIKNICFFLLIFCNN